MLSINILSFKISKTAKYEATPSAIKIRVFRIEATKKYCVRKTAMNIIVPESKYFHVSFMTDKNEMSFFEKKNISIVTHNSADIVAIQAPYDQRRGIKTRFSTRFKTAPQTIAIVYLESLFKGIKYCSPRTLLKPMIRISGEKIIIKVGTFS